MPAPKSISTVLIANRGEIAVRIIRACREMGIHTVAVYSEADRNSPYVSLADRACLIGPSPASESYLRIDAILDAALRTGADAIHPGYGFLSENDGFAEACEQAGITFVGPAASVIRLLGDKIRAKGLMANAGVPVVPGYHGEDQSLDRQMAEAHAIGAPILIKAAAGGGGRGMRVVRDLSQFAGELDEAKRESLAGFGDDRILLERYVERSRHVEVQIMGDAHGNVIHLFERECSIQRRHQKIVEESPSPVLTADLRARMASAAVSAGRAVGYVNAGTVEFLVEERPDDEPAFYFLEVNTRLQVEHPVTEMVTGLDLVQMQLRVASGEALVRSQGSIHACGHAVEVRIYAEDPATGFLPSLGKLEQWAPPQGPFIRVDSGVEQGGDVSPYYDPMLAKLIVYGETRAMALDRLDAALRDFHVLGVRTNIPYLLSIVRHPEFRSGRLSTRFLAEHLQGWEPPKAIPTDAMLALAAHVATRSPSGSAMTSNDGDCSSPWRSTNGWRNG